MQQVEGRLFYRCRPTKHNQQNLTSIIHRKNSLITQASSTRGIRQIPLHLKRCKPLTQIQHGCAVRGVKYDPMNRTGRKTNQELRLVVLVAIQGETVSPLSIQRIKINFRNQCAELYIAITFTQ